KFVPFIDKFCREEDKYQMASKLVIIAGFVDQDGSAELTASTVEMLMPTLKEQEKSKDYMTSHLAKGIPKSVRRVQMPGKEMKLEGVDIDGNIVDVKDFAGKVVFIQFYTTDEIDRLPILKKLYAALRNHGFVFIDYNMRDASEIAKGKAKELELPWTILCRYAAHEKKLEDYGSYYNVHSNMFIVGRDGKVIGTWSRGLCPAVWEKLKELFPEQAEKLTKLAAEDEQTRKETSEKYRKILNIAGIETDGTGNELFGTLMKNLVELNSANIRIGSDKERTQRILDLANLLYAMPDISVSQKNVALMKRIDLLEILGRIEMKEQPKTNPAIIFAEMLKAVDEALADDNINETNNNNLVFMKMSVFFNMWQYMKRSGDKAAIARDILNRYFEILRKETQHTNPFGGDNLSSFAQWVILGDLDDVPEFAQTFFDGIIPIFEKAKDPELQETAKRFRNIERRISSVGKELEFECILMNGEKINVKDLRGKIVLVNFWATWCGPCVKEFPNMKTQYEKYKPQGYEMIALSTDEEVDKIVKFQEKNNYPWLVGSQVKSKEAGLVDYHEYYGIQGVPMTFLLDREGKVLFRMVGNNDDRLNRELEKAFAK
ncbi:MAG: TlpA family protein disulfide reductase, partial [Planctomycetaceae bacterium]|nr:TlpA family protein disulfide reductase [Planctomycetaceae bacterium]